MGEEIEATTNRLLQRNFNLNNDNFLHLQELEVLLKDYRVMITNNKGREKEIELLHEVLRDVAHEEKIVEIVKKKLGRPANENKNKNIIKQKNKSIIDMFQNKA